MNTSLDPIPTNVSVGERIRAARHALGLTRQAFSHLTGMPAASLRNYELSKQIPGGEALKAFLRVGISANWLLAGEGAMLNSTAPRSALPGSPPSLSRYTKEKQPAYHTQDGATQPYAIPSTNGMQTFNVIEPLGQTESREGFLFSSTFLERLTGSESAQLRLVEITDDAMQPTLQPGWQVMIDTRLATNIHSGIYAIRLGDEIICKRLEPRPGRVIEVMSDNPIYSSYEINLNTITEAEFAIAGRVIWLAGSIR